MAKDIAFRVRMAPYIHLDTKQNVYLDYRKIIGVRDATKEEAEMGYVSTLFGEGHGMLFMTRHTVAEVFELMAAAEEKHNELNMV